MAALEAKLRGTDFINPSQMKVYQQMVGLVAYLLKKKNKGSEAHLHAEVKRVFDVPSYKLIPEEDFSGVQRFCAIGTYGWLNQVPPFLPFLTRPANAVSFKL